MIGTSETVLFLVLALLLFGPDRLPELSRMLGEALRELRDIINEKELIG